ncbi:hypothetical protein R6Q57_009693 [Mikania cordata]
MNQHYRRNHIPAFGSWDCNDDLPFTQCFESARQAGLIRYSGDQDLYVAGDLYENNVVTPAIIVAPRRRGNYQKETKKDVWPVEYDGDTKEPPADRRVKPKAVDEDLYKISPELLHTKPRRVSKFPEFMVVKPNDDNSREEMGIIFKLRHVNQNIYMEVLITGYLLRAG